VSFLKTETGIRFSTTANHSSTGTGIPKIPLNELFILQLYLQDKSITDSVTSIYWSAHSILTIDNHMKKVFYILIIPVITLIIMPSQLEAQNQYHDYKTLTKKIESLKADYPQLCSVRSLVRSAGGKDIWLISIGTGNPDSKPAIAVLGGVEGSHILGRELSLGFAASLLAEASSGEVKALLDKITFYILPDVNPDASEQFFSDLKYVRIANARPVDDDRDFSIDEDGFEDLNHDGLITLLRISDPSGRFIESHEDKRVMVEADISKGQSGNYLLFTEGIDNDKDGLYNEDGPGGVGFNRNFTFNYEFFGPGAGAYPVSEPETKAVADFLFERFNIYSVFAFGPQDNLGKPMTSENGPGKDGIIKTILKDDEPINKLVSDKYHEITGITGAPETKPCHGDFMEWAYFHYGRYSFSTPAWWFPVEKGKNEEAEFLKYAEMNKVENVFVQWTKVSHPDFPGKIAEVGGINPFSMINPPAGALDTLILKNYKFIKAVAFMHPELELLDVKTESAGDGISRISLKLHNKGIFATCAKIGEENMWTRIMRISVDLSNGQTILSGRKVQQAGRLEGGQTAEFSWLVNGKGTVKITAGSLNTGSVTAKVELK
jgi:hypothetical protein